MKPYLIVGIDPGTTTGWALSTLDGTILQIGSSKELGLGSLISIISSFGKPIIVGCDKQSIPHFVAAFARKFSSKVINPPHDLSVDLKRALTYEVQTGNSHELDALASCRFALKEIQPLYSKVHHLHTTEHWGISPEDIIETVLKTNLSIRGAMALLSQEETITLNRHPSPGPKPSPPPRILLTQLRNAQRELKELHTYTDTLEKTSSRQSSEITKLQHQLKHLPRPARPDLLSRHQQSTITNLTKALAAQKAAAAHLHHTISLLHDALLHPSTHTIAHILPDLTSSSLSDFCTRNELLTSTVFFIAHPHRYHRSVIEKLNEVQPLLLTDEKTPHHPLPLCNASQLSRIHLDRLMLFVTAEIKALPRQTAPLPRLLSDYKDSRSIPA